MLLRSFTNLEANSASDCGLGLSPSDCTNVKTNCNFNMNAFTKAQLDAGEFNVPWNFVTTSSVPSGTATAQWVGKTSLASDIAFAQQTSETGTDWVARVFNAAGVCGGASCGSASTGARCNTGSDCNYICEPVETFIKNSYGNATQAKEWQDGMLIDLGVEYTTCPVEKTCPTAAWVAAGNPRTVKQVGSLRVAK